MNFQFLFIDQINFSCTYNLFRNTIEYEFSPFKVSRSSYFGQSQRLCRFFPPSLCFKVYFDPSRNKLTERSIWILLFTPSPIMSAMSTISTAITPLASSPLASFFRLIISLCPVSAPKLCYRNILLHSIEKNSILGQNCWRIIAFCLFVFFFFYNSPPSRQRRLISIRNS